MKNTKYTSQNKVLKLTNDVVFKNILKDKHNKDFLVRIICLFTRLDKEYVSSHLIIADPDTLEGNAKEHHNTGDLVVDIENNRINIEMSIDNKKINKRKNEITSYKYAFNRFKVGDNYKVGYKFFQICFENYSVFNNNLVVNEVRLVEVSSGNFEIETDEYQKFHICLSKIPNTWYNKPELTEMERTLLFFITDDITKLTKISGGDNIMENTFDSLKSISEDSNIISEYENNQIFKYCYNLALAETKEEGFKQGMTKGINQGIKQGINQGIDQEKQAIGKKMIQEGIDINTISKITELTEEDIEKLRVA